jgi:hypothetical protein
LPLAPRAGDQTLFLGATAIHVAYRPSRVALRGAGERFGFWRGLGFRFRRYRSIDCRLAGFRGGATVGRIHRAFGFRRGFEHRIGDRLGFRLAGVMGRARLVGVIVARGHRIVVRVVVVASVVHRIGIVRVVVVARSRPAERVVIG